MVIIINRLTFSCFICKFSIHMAPSTHLGISLALNTVYGTHTLWMYTISQLWMFLFMRCPVYLQDIFHHPFLFSPPPPFLAVPHDLQDLTSLTRDWIQPRPPQWKHEDLTPGPPGNSQPSTSLHSHNQNLPDWAAVTVPKLSSSRWFFLQPAPPTRSMLFSKGVESSQMYTGRCT